MLWVCVFVVLDVDGVLLLVFLDLDVVSWREGVDVDHWPVGEDLVVNQGREFLKDENSGELHLRLA